MRTITPRMMATTIARSAHNHKGTDVRVLDVRDVTDIADFFVIISSRSTTHTRSMADNIKKDMSAKQLTALHRDGYYRETRWTVVDYGTVIVHICMPEVRSHYDIDHLWHGSKSVSWKRSASS
jgi:ribosome-associated protein